MSVSVTGDKELLRKINRLSVDLQQATREAVYGTAQSVRSYAIKSIQQQSMGGVVRRYRQGGGSYNHVVSQPGQAPNTDTGRLVSSISVQPLKPANEMYVGTTLEYGKHLEHGTMNMQERPWLQPALDAMIQRFREELEKAIDRQLEKATR